MLMLPSYYADDQGEGGVDERTQVNTMTVIILKVCNMRREGDKVNNARMTRSPDILQQRKKGKETMTIAKR